MAKVVLEVQGCPQIIRDGIFASGRAGDGWVVVVGGGWWGVVEWTIGAPFLPTSLHAHPKTHNTPTQPHPTPPHLVPTVESKPSTKHPNATIDYKFYRPVSN